MPEAVPRDDTDVPSFDRLAVGFARLLRASGLDVPVGSTIAFAEAVAAVGIDRRESVYWAGRVTLVRQPEDVETYDRSFAAWWEHVHSVSGATQVVHDVVLAFDDAGDTEPEIGSDEDSTEDELLAVRYSRTEVLRHRDFAQYSHEEFAESRRLMADIRLAGSLRRSRRLRPSRRRRGRPDLRRTVRRAIRSGGEPIRRAFVEPSARPRRLVLLCDVSGSMEAYARGLVRVLHAAVVGRGRVEAFALGTRLTRITRELSSR
ncbi:MAG: VWA domain-containing protein, partial [Acidimicrobiia bacterium]